MPENHSHEGYYSEMGVYKSNGEYISFVGKKDKISEVNVGSGFMDVEYNTCRCNSIYNTSK